MSKNRRSKVEIYKEEREELIKNLNEMIGLNKSNKILLYDLEVNEELKEYLRGNSDKIKKIYKTCLWGYYSKEKKKGMGNEIGLLKSIYKNDDWEISNKRVMNERGGIKKIYMELHFNKKVKEV